MGNSLTNETPDPRFDADLVARFGPINANTTHVKGCLTKKHQVYETAKGKQNIDLIQRMVLAYQTGDLDAHDDIWAEDVIWHGPPGFGDVHGYKAFKRDVLKGIYYQLFPDFYDDVEVQIADDEWISATGFVCGTHTGDWFGVKGTGKTACLRYSDFWRVENGKLKENWLMIDQIGLTQQLIKPLPQPLPQPFSQQGSQPLPQSLSLTLSQPHAHTQLQLASLSIKATKNLALVDRMLEHFVNHHLAGQNQVWSEDMIWHGPPGLGRIKGVAAFKHEVIDGTFYKAFPDLHANLEIKMAVGDFVAGTGHITGSHLGDWFGIAPTARKIKLLFSAFWRIERDRLIESWMMIDHIALLQQLGFDPCGAVYPADSLDIASSVGSELFVNQGLINEKYIANLGSDTQLLRLGKHTKLTALARDKARSMGITIEKTGQ
ncbi:MAG: ester cyclase [Pseudomonadales bacterium]